MRDLFEKIRQHSLHVSKYVISLFFCFLFFASADYVAGKLFSRHRAPEPPGDPVEESADHSAVEPGTATRGLASVRGKMSPSARPYEPGTLGSGRPDERYTALAGEALPIAASGADMASAQGSAFSVTSAESAKAFNRSAAASATGDDAGNSLAGVGAGYIAPSTDTSTSTSTATSASLVWGTGTWGSGLWGP